MTDQTTPPAASTSAIMQLFSPSALAALRNVLAAVGTVLGLFGVVALDPAQIDRIINIAAAIGPAVGAVVAALGLITPLITGGIAAFKATQKQQIQSVSVIAQDPTQAQSAPAQQALVTATAAIAQNNVLEKSSDAKDTLINATIALDNVQTIVTDKDTALRTPSESVIAAEEVDIVKK